MLHTLHMPDLQITTYSRMLRTERALLLHRSHIHITVHQGSAQVTFCHTMNRDSAAACRVARSGLRSLFSRDCSGLLLAWGCCRIRCTYSTSCYNTFTTVGCIFIRRQLQKSA